MDGIVLLKEDQKTAKRKPVDQIGHELTTHAFTEETSDAKIMVLIENEEVEKAWFPQVRAARSTAPTDPPALMSARS